jgi:DNA-binding Lrp family transcriptional regulator
MLQHIFNSKSWSYYESKENLKVISAVVLVNTNLGEEHKVLEKIKKVVGVEEAHALWGVYDLMVRIKANSIDMLKEIIKSGLRQLSGVSNVLTLMIIENSQRL